MSKGLREAFLAIFKRDYVYQSCLETMGEVGRQLPAWVGHYNPYAFHCGLGMRSSAGFYVE